MESILDPNVSSVTSLLNTGNVCGHGAPTHTPHLVRQSYIDVDTGRVWEWFNNAWH